MRCCRARSHIIRTQVFVPQDQAFGLAPGVKAVVRVPEMPDRTFPGEVTRISDALQQGTRTLLVEIDVPNPDGALTPGIYCTVDLQIPRKSPSLLIPANAIIFNRDGLQVAVVENGVAHIRKISVTRDLGTQVEVRDGVKAGDQVILNPMVDLMDGSRVRTRAPAAWPRSRRSRGGGVVWVALIYSLSLRRPDDTALEFLWARLTDRPTARCHQSGCQRFSAVTQTSTRKC